MKLLRWTFNIILILGIVAVGAWYGINNYIDKATERLINNFYEEEFISLDFEQKANNNSEKNLIVDSVDLGRNIEETIARSNTDLVVLADDEVQDKIEVVVLKDTDVKRDVKAISTEENDAFSKIDTLISSEDIKDKVNSVSSADKLAVTSILLSRFTMKDINMVLDFVEGGFTEEEKETAKELVLKRLDSKDYEMLVKLAMKYF